VARKRGWLKGLNRRHIAAIELMQPYKGCKWSAGLRDLSNRDKHRELPTLISAGDVEIFGILAHSTPKPSNIFRAKHPLTGEEMDVKLDVDTVIAFDDGTPIIETLEKIELGVGNTLKTFQPEFQRR
jgi:hypothetical protein